MKILLKNAEYIDALGNCQIGAISISDSIITSMGSINEHTEYDKIIDCTNKLVVPGFVNTHTHAAMSLFRSYADDMKLMDWLENKIWPLEANLTADDIYWGTQLAIAEMIRTGTTTFADMYFFMPEVAKAVEETGIRAVLSRGMAGVTPSAEAALVESKEFYQNWHNSADGRINVMLGPHAPYTCPPDYLKRVISLAHELKAEIHIHLAETQDEVTNCIKEHGCSPIKLMDSLGLFECGTLAAHCVHLSEEDIEILSSKKVRVAHNPGSNMKLASGISPIPQMLEKGICVGLGTDGAASNNNLDMLEEQRLAALLHKVHSQNPLAIPAKTAYQMATEFGAKALNLTNTGLLKEGYKADITIFDMNKPHWQPRHDRLSLLTYAASAYDVDIVIVNGKVLLENKILSTIDEEKLTYEVAKRSAKLISMAGGNTVV